MLVQQKEIEVKHSGEKNAVPLLKLDFPAATK